MSAVSQFNTRIWPSLTAAVRTAVATTMTDGFKRAIKKEAQEKVYAAYSPKKGPRRGIIGDEGNLFATAAGFVLTITNNTGMQGPNYGVSETTFVEGGLGNYNQPFKREFMEPARDKYVAGEASEDLAAALRAAGFVVT